MLNRSKKVMMSDNKDKINLLWKEFNEKNDDELNTKT
jgi:hypothetical protein